MSLAACTSDTPTSTPEPTTPVSTTAPSRSDDGVLQIGVLLPRSGAGAAIGQSARAAVQLAVDQVNALGGISGQPVKLLVRSEGIDPTEAALSLQQLIENQVDVIIGPASSNNAIALVPRIVEAGIAACSPTASAMALDDIPDNGLFFRTVPSDSLQADAMAEVIEQTGRASAAIAYVDDGYGRPFEDALRRALVTRGIVVDDSVGFAATDDEYETEAERLVGSGEGALALIGDADAGSRMLAALADALSSQPRSIIINDTLRQPWSQSLLDLVLPETRSRVRGVSVRVSTLPSDLLEQFDDTEATDVFATQAYDCANLFMLAALDTGSTLSERIAADVVDVSNSGSRCTTYEQCAALVAQGREIDYDGPGGSLTLNGNGDLASSVFDEFSFDATGRDVSADSGIAGDVR